MTVAETMRAEHLAKEAARFDDAVASAKRWLNDKDPDVRTLVYRLLWHGDVYAMFGADGRNGLNGFSGMAIARGCWWLESVTMFVSYHLLKHYEPGVGYMRHDFMKGFVPCPKDHEDAQPYFHCNVDYLRETVPDAEQLSVKRALEILDWYDAKRAEMKAWVQEEAARGDGFMDEDDVASYDLNAEQVALKALADELTEGGVRDI